MKILLINSVCGVGSTGKICVQIANLAKEQGHECVIAYGRGEVKGYDNVYKIESSFGNKLHYLKSRLFDKHGLGSTIVTKKFIKFIKEYNPDVIHLHNIHGYYLNYKILFKVLKEFKGKIFWTLHDLWAFTGHCAYPNTCEKWKNGCNRCERLKYYPSSVIDNSRKNYKQKKELFTSLKRAVIITPSKWLEKLVKESYLAKYETKVINNGIDLNIFQPTESDFRKKHGIGDKKIILGVSNIWEKRKGLDDFIELSKRVDKDTQIVLVGLSEEQIKDLPDNVLGIKRTNGQKELAEIYSTADLFVNFTYDDNFPTVNIESIACGTPVLTYKTGGSYEMLDESCNFGVETGDLEKAVEIIKGYKKTDIISIKVKKHATNFNQTDKFLEYIREYEK